MLAESPSPQKRASWQEFYALDPVGLNRVIPIWYLLMLGALAAMVAEPAVLAIAGTVLLAFNMALFMSAQRLSLSIQRYHRMERCRFLVNAFIETAIIVTYAAETPAWLVAIPGALGFCVIWEGKQLLVTHVLHLLILSGATVWSGTTLLQTALMISAYGLCAAVPSYLMTEVRRLLKTQRTSAKRARVLEQDILREELANQRRSTLNSVNQLAASLAHEVNNPLFAVLGNLEYVETELNNEPRTVDGSATSELLDAIRDAAAAGRSISEIISQMRSYGQLLADELTPINLNEVISGGKEAFTQRISDHVELILDLNDVPAISGTETALHQIVTNLVANANQATSPSTDKRQIVVSTQTDALNRAVLTVADSGQGIDADDLSRIFTPFYTTNPGRGAGLGLPIVHDIVDRLGGRIDVSSTKGKGTTFELRFPSCELLPTREDDELNQSQKLSGCRILVIDDDASIGRTVSRMLEDNDVIYVPDAASAERYFAEEPAFDAVLCDVVMPECSGIELFRRVQEKVAPYSSLWIFMSGGANSERDQKFLEQSDCPFLRKPVSRQRLTAAILDVMRADASRN